MFLLTYVIVFPKESPPKHVKTTLEQPENIGIQGDVEAEGELESEEEEQEVEGKGTSNMNRNAAVDKGNISEEDVNQFLESQRRISKIKSVTNEREVRLLDIEGKNSKNSKKSKKSSNGANKTSSDSGDATTANRANMPLAEIPEEGTPDRITKAKSKRPSQIKAEENSKRSAKKSFAVSGTSDNSTNVTKSRVRDSIARLQQKIYYKVIYFFMYYWLALNDHFRLLFVPKSGDIAFFIFTLLFLIIFIIDII